MRAVAQSDGGAVDMTVHDDHALLALQGLEKALCCP